MWREAGLLCRQLSISALCAPAAMTDVSYGFNAMYKAMLLLTVETK